MMMVYHSSRLYRVRWQSNPYFIERVIMKIGQKCKELRESKGLSRQQLGYRWGITPQGIYNFEKGVNTSGYLLREYIRMGVTINEEDEF